jgi:spore germination cell wall hydrolase CwlJ-like protein
MLSAAVVCMALNIYFEARSEPLVGQLGVAHSVLNRMSSPKYPDHACDVIYQPKQYSWYSDGKSDKPKDDVAYLEATILAQRVLDGQTLDITEGALWYHADYVDPHWAAPEHMDFTVKLGKHLFYRQKHG